jgi:y4mF family transcriptional regulator
MEITVRLANTRELALYVRDRRRHIGLTQTQLSAQARVSRRWLSDVESGKETAEIGLVFRLLHALGLTLEARPLQLGPDDIDLDVFLRRFKGGSSEGGASEGGSSEGSAGD